MIDDERYVDDSPRVIDDGDHDDDSDIELSALEQLRVARGLVCESDKYLDEYGFEARKVFWDNWHSAVRRFNDERRGRQS